MSIFKKLLLILRLIPKLGYRNVWNVFMYRLCLKIGLFKAIFRPGTPVTGPFFKEVPVREDYPARWKDALQEKAAQIVSGKYTWFFRHIFSTGHSTPWFYNPFLKVGSEAYSEHWTSIQEFRMETGDVKVIWELSRFDWLTDLARAYRVFGGQTYLDALNEMLASWSLSNPLNIGPNWKCGQEASFRVLKMFTAACILESEHAASQPVKQMIREHISRIRPTIRYAIAQQNNHATSEAAALYIGALFLLHQQDVDPREKKKWIAIQKKSRGLLEKLILQLVLPDGTFAQKSTNYHRVVMDTISVVLHAMKVYGEKPFREAVRTRLHNLGNWQRILTFGADGETPVTGANDGAMIESMHCHGYRDFRPSTQQFFGLLENERVYEEDFDEPLFWRMPGSLTERIAVPPLANLVRLLDNQYLVIRRDRVSFMMILPDDRFRPGQDPFHVDLWVNGKNILTDCGSYSYHAGSLTDAFKSISSHNTIQFGDLEPMPKVGRFLNASWIKAARIRGPEMKDDQFEFSASYQDGKKNCHIRSLHLSGKKLCITDQIVSGNPAFARFHLVPGTLVSVDEAACTVHLQDATLRFEGGHGMQVLNGWHSYYYLEKDTHRVIQVKVTADKLLTTIQLN